MSTPNQIRFLTEIKNTLEEGHAGMVKLEQQREVYKRKVKDGIWTQDYADSEIEAIDRQAAKIHDDCEDKAYNLIESRLVELDKADVLDAAQLNDDCELLRFDILTQKDIDQLAERNSSNPTVSRLIARYAEKHGLTVSLPDYILTISAAKREASDMKEVVRVGLRWIGDEKNGQNVLNRLFPQVVSQD